MYHTPKSVVSALAVTLLVWPCSAAFGTHLSDQAVREDRKSTRLNSSHDQISYAVFCLKKKKANPTSTPGLKISTFSHTAHARHKENVPGRSGRLSQLAPITFTVRVSLPPTLNRSTTHY